MLSAMPVILSFGGKTESGHEYDDKFGEHYTYPSLYRKLVSSGDICILYRGKRDNTGGFNFARYAGFGIVGTITPTGESSGKYDLLRCEILYSTPFDNPVPVKNENREYFEEGANNHKKPPLWFSRGVRIISEEGLAKIAYASRFSR